VDDDLLSRQLLQTLLEQENYEVVLAENGEIALALAASHLPDVVLLDVVMPGRNGYEVCRQLRGDAALHQTHILLLTSLEGRESRLSGLIAGADDFLNKPIDLIELRTRLHTITRLNRFRQLSQERARFEAAVTHSPDGIAFIDDNGEIMHANPAFDRIVRCRRPVFDFLPKEVAHRLRLDATALEIGQAVGPKETILQHTPEPVQVEISLVRLPPANGIAFQVVLRDITERKQLEHQLLRSQRTELLGQLAGGIVHDTNNIFAAIAGHATVLSFCDPHAAPTHIQTIQQSAQRGASLLRGILAFARGAEGNRAPLDLPATVQEALGIAKQLIGRQIAVSFESAPGLPAIHGDANQIHQIVLNLCVNARDAMPTGGKLALTMLRTEVTPANLPSLVSEARPGDFVALAVSDTGHGIPDHVRPRLFEPFFTTKPANIGTGLGLATVHRLVREHGGFIAVDSTVNVGSCFTCYLPVPQSAA